VRSASGDDGRKLFQHVGHRGPVYKGLGAMNPCDHLPSIYQVNRKTFESNQLEGSFKCFHVMAWYIYRDGLIVIRKLGV
jgi:hypothetical protein